MKPLDPYTALELDKTATPDQVRRAYRKRAAKFHPDNLDTGDAAEFLQVTKAHKLLSDPQAKSIYDQTGIIAGEDRLAEEAIALIVDVASNVTAENPLCDLPAVLKDQISRLSQMTEAGIAKIQKSVNAIEERWEGAETVRAAVLMTFRNRIAALERTKAVHTRAQELLKESRYKQSNLDSLSGDHLRKWILRTAI